MRRAFPWWQFIAACCLAVPLAAPATPAVGAPDAHCLFECPKGGRGQIVVHTLITLRNNAETKFADWVAYVVTPDTVSDNDNRSWHFDDDIDADETLEKDDFKHAADKGYDMGHQAPLNSLGSGSDWTDLNALSNITPQKASLNRGVWKSLEGREEGLINDGFPEVYVVTGTLYETEMPKLPNADETHRVPSSYWKVIAAETVDGWDFAAFIMPQSHRRGAKKMCDYQVSIDEVERRSGLNLFGELPDAKERTIEAAMPGGLAGNIGC